MKRFLTLSLALLMAASSAARASTAGALKLPPYKKVQLKNGLTVLLMEQHEVPVVSFNFILKAGS
ncbi:MAG TPA: insulinase family protein, partial [Blastocatellia bacterium]|nr:insulinase family protein [Blastocatellia bacterium]